MKRARFQIFLVGGLLALLGVLAGLQYVWLGQISEAEKDRMTRRLQTDTERFGEDFNREIQGAYVNFQFNETLWQQKDWAQFNERYDFWREKTAYPQLIGDFYYFENKPNAALARYDPVKREFSATDWTGDLQAIRENAADSQKQEVFDEDRFALVMPVYEAAQTFERIVIRKTKEPPPDARTPKPPPMTLPDKKAFLVIRLDEAVVKNRILPDLAKKHFPDGDFRLAVVGRRGQPVFQTQAVTAVDASAGLFDLSPDNLIFFANREILPRAGNGREKGVIISQSQSVSTIKTETLPKTPPDGKSAEKKTVGTFQFELKNDEKPRTFIQATSLPTEGNWTLNVQHAAGSLDQFISAARTKNLAVSFGILGLLAVSIVLIFVSAQRAKVFAQRQIDFVSSVSHEFRTPLAVIYSAGENLADGVAKEERQVSRYGQLIKGEGRKLSRMVEQILEFAGADAGRKKYDFRERTVAEIVESAIRECRTQLDEQEFKLEKSIAEKLPPVKADATALSQAIQNLIFNSLKYSNGAKWLKISATNGGGRIKITVEDHGIGIAPADLKHIFEPFYRAKAVVDEQIHGNGLGLSLVRETVEAHGGRISAESEIGRGSRFTIALPAKSA